MKTFIVEIQDSTRTRWDVGDDVLALHLQVLAESVARVNSVGSVPKATVTPIPSRVGQCYGCGCEIVLGSVCCPACAVKPRHEAPAHQSQPG